MTQAEIPSLYQWAGGMERLQALMQHFYAQVHRDELLMPIFANMSEHHAQLVAAFIAEVFGGPKTYSEQGKSHASMVAKHLGKHLNEAQRQRWMQLLLASADELGLPDDPEFRSSLVGYLEWGSRLAVINSQLDDNPLEQSVPMPEWGWGETKGPWLG